MSRSRDRRHVMTAVLRPFTLLAPREGIFGGAFAYLMLR